MQGFGYSTSHQHARTVRCNECKHVLQQIVTEGCFGSEVDPLFCPSCGKYDDFEMALPRVPIFPSDVKGPKQT